MLVLVIGMGVSKYRLVLVIVKRGRGERWEQKRAVGGGENMWWYRYGVAFTIPGGGSRAAK